LFPNVEYIKTLVNGLKEFVNSKIKSVRKDIDELPQLDWNQNDPAAKDYVKNRTHWTAVEEVGGNGESAFIAGSWAYNNPSLVFSTITGLGKTYHNIPLQENGKYIEAVVGDYTISHDRYLGGMSVSPNTATVTDFNFFYKKEVSHPIPDRYIPDWVADKDSIPDPQVQANWYEKDTKSKAYIIGKPYIKTYIHTSGTLTESGYVNVPNSGHCTYIRCDYNFKDLPAIVYVDELEDKPLRIVLYEDWSSNSGYIKGNYKILDIYSSITGLKMTEEELPLERMVLFVCVNGGIYECFCLNPRPKDYFASTDALPQHAMSADPTEDMQIATKKYVDDNTLGQTIQKIESTDQSNMVSIRSIDSGTYILYGYFKPYVGADSTMTFSANLLVNILKGDTESHVQVFYPYNNCVQYLKITDNSYERKDTYLGNLMSKTDDVIINSSTEGSSKKFKITVDDTGAITATEVTE